MINTQTKITLDDYQTSRTTIYFLEERGQGDYVGESTSQLEHCLQVADLPKQGYGMPDTIVAALLYDIGQFLPIEFVDHQICYLNSADVTHSLGRVGHELIGEQHPQSLDFGSSMSCLVGSHVAAKRYLTVIDPEYYAGLSSESQQSLELRGGPLMGKKLDEFRADPLSEEMVRLRRWDDLAKVDGIENKTVRAAAYEQSIEKRLKRQQQELEKLLMLP